MKFSPDAARVKELEETGTRFARQLLQSQKRAQRRSAGGLSESRSDPAVLALGRVIGSLCVLTTRKAELSGAMVASWGGGGGIKALQGQHQGVPIVGTLGAIAAATANTEGNPHHIGAGDIDRFTACQPVLEGKVGAAGVRAVIVGAHGLAR